jgi:hypothetical protein
VRKETFERAVLSLPSTMVLAAERDIDTRAGAADDGGLLDDGFAQ